MGSAGAMLSGNGQGLLAMLSARARGEPFLVVATCLFALAILHTFLAPVLSKASHHSRGVRSRLLHVASEVELVFALWALVVVAALAIVRGPSEASVYVGQLDFAEPVFVVVIMALAGSEPIRTLAEAILGRVAAAAGGSVNSWWLSVLILGPLLGSFISEPGAMTLCALVLRSRFYRHRPSRPLAYATLGLLFVNISAGGAMTPFGAPPIVMVAQQWGWTVSTMLGSFAWRSVATTVVATMVTFAVHRRELRAMTRAEGHLEEPPPLFPRGSPLATIVLVALLVATLLLAHSIPGLVAVLAAYLATVRLSGAKGWASSLRQPLWVGIFLAGLVVHGGLQGWWLGPIMHGLGPAALFAGSAALSAFNDNAAITYLASQGVPPLALGLRYMVVAGAITGGGLTVIANAPNPAGQALLRDEFGEDGISAWGLARGALVPTAIAALIFFAL